MERSWARSVLWRLLSVLSEWSIGGGGCCRMGLVVIAFMVCMTRFVCMDVMVVRQVLVSRVLV